MSQLHTVHVRINDAATGQPTPCRVRFVGADGTYYAPFGRLTQFCCDLGKDVGGNLWDPKEEKAYAYIDGTCEIALPTGQIEIEVSKGFEYRPLKQTCDLKEGQLSIRLTLERWINMREQGWYSGDMHVEYMTPHAALLEAQAEDVAVVNLLARATFACSENEHSHPAIPNILAFSGQKPAVESPGHMVVVNTVNWHPELGQLILLNCHRVVYPLYFGNTHGLDNWTLAAWCDQCHRKGGLVIGDIHAHVSEFMLGKADAGTLFTVWHEGPDGRLSRWHERPRGRLSRDGGLWSLGCRFPLVAGSTKLSNQTPLGSQRTFAKLAQDEEFNYHNWIEAVRQGRTFVSSGALIDLTVNGHPPGTVIQLENPDQVVHVRVVARSVFGLNWLGLMHDGQAIAHPEIDGSSFEASIEMDVRFERSGWLQADCTGAGTSPVYVEVQGHPIRIDEELLPGLVGVVEDDLHWAKTRARCENDKQREQLVAVYEQAKQELLRRIDANV